MTLGGERVSSQLHQPRFGSHTSTTTSPSITLYSGYMAAVAHDWKHKAWKKKFKELLVCIIYTYFTILYSSKSRMIYLFSFTGGLYLIRPFPPPTLPSLIRSHSFRGGEGCYKYLRAMEEWITCSQWETFWSLGGLPRHPPIRSLVSYCSACYGGGRVVRF